MINKKGFTLMELLVALFIGTMVTVALVSIWRGASMQTSQGMRQAIVRNNLSIFMRALHRDLTEADIILYPDSGLTEPSGGVFLIGAYNATRTSNEFSPARAAFGPSTYFYYCFDGEKHLVRRVTGPVQAQLTDEVGAVLPLEHLNIINFIDDTMPAACNAGAIVMDNVNTIRLRPVGNIQYKLDMNIYRDFGGNSVPLNFNIIAAFAASGGRARE